MKEYIVNGKHYLYKEGEQPAGAVEFRKEAKPEIKSDASEIETEPKKTDAPKIETKPQPKTAAPDSRTKPPAKAVAPASKARETKKK